MEMGGIFMEAVERAIGALERNAQATEAMLGIAEKEQIIMEEPGPPMCPYCNRLDPEATQIRVEGGSGKLSELVMAFEVHCCNKTIYAVPDSLTTMGSIEQANMLLAMKKGGRTDVGE
jgi:hypothetical protein